MNKYLQFIKKKWFLFVSGLVSGSLLILGIRFFTYMPETVHYHANFAVFVNSQREKFEGMQFYEETEATSCTLEKVESPLERAHMHGNVNDVVHVEDHLVTWGNFFQNLGWGVGDDYLKTTDRIYSPDEQNKLTLTLNGNKVDSIANLIVGDEDKLLVSYGNSSSEELDKQYENIQSTAHKYNTEKDPASCGGHKSVNTSERLKHLF